MAANSVVERRRRILEMMGDPSPKTGELLLDSLYDDDPLVREWALEGLMRRPGRGVESADLLIGLLNEDPRAERRAFAALGLARLRVASEDVREALIDALGDEDLLVRCLSALTIARIGLAEPEVAAFLREQLLQLSGSRITLEAETLAVALTRLHVPRACPPLEAEGAGAQPFEPPFALDTPVDQLPSLRETVLTGMARLVTEIVADRIGVPLDADLPPAVVGRLVHEYTVKESVVARRGPHCQICNALVRESNGLFYCECHHVVPTSRGGSDQDENLLVLCPNHHIQFHAAAVEVTFSEGRPSEVKIGGDRYPVRWPPVDTGAAA